jgi:hypothetical protein
VATDDIARWRQEAVEHLDPFLGLLGSFCAEEQEPVGLGVPYRGANHFMLNPACNPGFLCAPC